MKSQQKRTLAKKQKQQASNMLTDEQLKALEPAGGSSDILTDTIMPSYTYSYSPGATVGGITSVSIPSFTTGTSASTYTIDTSAYNWNSSYTSTVNIDTNGITLKEGSDIKVGGKSLTEAIEKIEERLGILKPNPELEDRWEQLKVLRQQYIDLEKELLEKEKMWKILKEK